MSTIALTLSQANYVNRAFWRNPARAMLTFALPLIFLVIFTSLLGNGTVRIGALAVKESTYYVASMAAFGVISSCFTNTAISTTFSRDGGILRRIDGTPLPHAVFFASRILHATLVAVVLVAITTAFGHFAYSAHVPSGATLVRYLVMLLVGSAAFCALGFAITATIPNADAAAPIVNISILPLLFLSGIFIPFGNSTPDWMLWIARVFPVRHFAVGLQAGYVGTPFDYGDVAIVAAWGLAGLLLAIRFFGWQPHE